MSRGSAGGLGEVERKTPELPSDSVSHKCMIHLSYVSYAKSSVSSVTCTTLCIPLLGDFMVAVPAALTALVAMG